MPAARAPDARVERLCKVVPVAALTHSTYMPPELSVESMRALIDQASPLPDVLRQPRCAPHMLVFRCVACAFPSSAAPYSGVHSTISRP